MAVVLYHAGVGIAGGGYVGVDIFFVVSGFLITGLLWRDLERHGRISFQSFYARRARRLLPASVLVVSVTMIASAWLLAPLQVHDVIKDGLASSLYLANFRFALQSTNYLTSTAPPSPFQHFWSLAVEEQFYLVWPAMLVGISLLARSARRDRRSTGPPSPSSAPPSPSRTAVATGLAIVATASLILSLWLTTRNQPWAFFSLPTRAWELAAGGLVALGAPWLRRLPDAVSVGLGWIGMALIAWSITQFSATTSFPGSAALAPVAGAAAVIAAGSAGALWGPVIVLRQRVFLVLGKISYSWYLWHWPVLLLAPFAVGRPFSVWGNIGLVGLSGVMAAATVVLVEAPVRFSPWLAAPARRSLALGGTLTVAAVAGCALVAVTLPSLQGHGVAPIAGGAAAGAPSAPTRAANAKVALDPAAAYSAAAAPVLAAVSGSIGSKLVPSNLEPSLARAHSDEARPFVDGCLDSFTESVVRSCVYGVPSSSTTVVLFGDSHAAQWFPPFDDLANSRGWRLVVLTKATCPPAEIAVFSPELGRSYRECDAWRSKVLARIRAEHPVLVVLGVARHYSTDYQFTVYSPEWSGGLAAMVRTISRTGSAVAVMGSIPKPPADVPNCLSAHLSSATACSRPLADVYSGSGVAAEQAAVVAAGGSYLDTHTWFCTTATCAVMVDNLLVYRDDNHLTTSYASWLARVVGAALDESALRHTSTSAAPPPH